MRRTLAVAALMLALMPGLAAAGERPADAALGALSGALVFGPVGLVAGAVVGYTAGPSISHGLRRGEPRQARRASSYEARASVGDPQPMPQDNRPQAAPPSAAPVAAAPAAAPPPARSTATTAPPVQPLE
jgi:hypothetical protein